MVPPFNLLFNHVLYPINVAWSRDKAVRGTLTLRVVFFMLVLCLTSLFHWFPSQLGADVTLYSIEHAFLPRPFTLILSFLPRFESIGLGSVR